MSINRIAINRGRSRSRLPGLLALLVVLAGAHCQSTAPASDTSGSAARAEVIVYGRKTCPICARFVRNLEAQSIAYDFRSVNDRNEAAAMWAIVRERFPGEESVGLPVVVFGERAWIRPRWSEFESYWKTTR